MFNFPFISLLIALSTRYAYEMMSIQQGGLSTKAIKYYDLLSLNHDDSTFKLSQLRQVQSNLSQFYSKAVTILTTSPATAHPARGITGRGRRVRVETDGVETPLTPSRRTSSISNTPSTRRRQLLQPRVSWRNTWFPPQFDSSLTFLFLSFLCKIKARGIQVQCIQRFVMTRLGPSLRIKNSSTK
jgi:hypothetical protein